MMEEKNLKSTYQLSTYYLSKMSDLYFISLNSAMVLFFYHHYITRLLLLWTATSFELTEN